MGWPCRGRGGAMPEPVEEETWGGPVTEEEAMGDARPASLGKEERAA